MRYRCLNTTSVSPPYSSITSLALTTEPTAEFSSLLQSIRSLDCLTITTSSDMDAMISAIPAESRAILRSLSIASLSTSAHFVNHLDGFPDLVSLSLYTIQSIYSSLFFDSIRQLPIESLEFRGTRGPHIDQLTDFLEDWEEGENKVKRVSIDVHVGQKGVEWTKLRDETSAKRLDMVCRELGIELGGTIVDALNI